MQTLRMDMTERIDPAQMRRAGQILLDGGLVAFPTETVYGLGGNALDADASAKIYAAKGRPSDNPLIVHIARIESLFEITQMDAETEKQVKLLSDTFWPGPLTMILPKNRRVPDATTGGLDTVAIRMPAHPAALELIRCGGGFIAAPSANTSGRPSPTRAEHVIHDLDGRIDAVIDGGEVGIGIESTIIDLTEEIPVILRPGYISLEMLREVLGEVRMDRGLMSEDPAFRPKAPGMKYRHYAPEADLSIVEGRQEDVIRTICDLAMRDLAQGLSVGIIASDETGPYYEDLFSKDTGRAAGSDGSAERRKTVMIRSAGSRKEEITIAMHLYALLRDFDEAAADRIYSEAFDTPRIGQAIMNRLIKAAGHQIILAGKGKGAEGFETV